MSNLPRGPAIALLTRAPEPGRTKSRLAAVIGETAAAALAEAFLLDTAGAIGSVEGTHAALFVEPDREVRHIATVTGIADAHSQGHGDIGARMLAAHRALAAGGYAPVIIVGSDIPTLTGARFRQALAALNNVDVVFGPAVDGGYYLVGAALPHEVLFLDPSMEWSGAGVLAASQRLARRAGLTTARLPVERDIDTAKDLAWLREHLAARARDGAPVPRRTAAALAAVGSANLRL